MDKFLEDLLNIPNDNFIEIEEIESKEKIDIFDLTNNPDRYDKNCNCKTCIHLRSIIDDPQQKDLQLEEEYRPTKVQLKPRV
tara:strand:+ start:669 stop:914 length:246 start_codon:yes stop_codon:yes gene_type:complete